MSRQPHQPAQVLEVPVRQAARSMVDLGVEELTVLTPDGEPVGVVRDRDFTRFVAMGENPHGTSIGEILGRSDEQTGRLLQQRPPRCCRELRAEQIMSTPAVVCRTDAPMEDVFGLLSTRGLSGLPVVDEQDRVVGLLSQRDVARALGGPAPKLALRRSAKTGPFLRGGEPKRAGDLMSSPVLADAHTPISALAQTMLARAADQVVVVSEQRPVGIVTRADLLRALIALGASGAEEARPEPAKGRTES